MSAVAENLSPGVNFNPDNIDLELAETSAFYHFDPYGWVMWSFDWGYGELEGFDGLDDWQVEWLQDYGRQLQQNNFDGVTPVTAIRKLTASGHGIGKSALVAMVILFIMSTRPFAKGIVTANTGDQLRTKTWGELAKWKSRCITGHWFELNSGKGSLSMYHKSWPETWRVDAQTCREENSEAFAGLHAANSTPFYIFDEACHDDQTEVLTISGWKLFKDVTPADQLLTMNTQTQEAYYDHPSHLHVSDYVGQLLVTQTRAADFAVTPNHRMLFESRKLPGQLRLEEAGAMVWSNKYLPRRIQWVGDHQEVFTIPGYEGIRKSYPARAVSMDDWCEFLGWFVTEGHTQRQQWDTKAGVNSAPSVTVITQKQQHYREQIAQLVERMGFSYRERDTGVYIYDLALNAYLDGHVGKGFDGKRVPRHVFNLTPAQIGRFLDAAVKGDGYRRATRDVLYTSSEALADDYQELVLLEGRNSTITKRKLKGNANWINDHYAVSTCDGYVVTRTDESTRIEATKAKPTPQHYEGKVYCATISGGVLYTRRNGRTMWSGNSAVPDKIWEVAEGGLTDGEPLIAGFGNPTRNTGAFSRNFNSARWTKQRVDSRTAKMTNKAQIQQWAEDWGEDSDFFRVRVRGVFPRAGDMQFIPGDVVTEALKRGPGRYIGNDPLICGFDVARGGDDNCMITFRRGKDAKSERTYRIPGEKSRDSMRVVSMITMIFDRHMPDQIFVDETGLGGPIVDRLRQLGYPVTGVNFGAKADDEQHFVNKTAEMGFRCRQWLIEGGAITDDPQLENELTVREFWHDDKDRLVLERKKDLKKRLGVSPDWADALYLTFAQHVPALDHERGMRDVAPWARENVNKSTDYDPIDYL